MRITRGPGTGRREVVGGLVTAQRLEDTLGAIVRKHSRVTVQAVRDDTTLAGDLAFDSLALLMMVTDLQEALHVEFPLEDIDCLQDLSFGELVRLVRDRLETAVRAPLRFEGMRATSG
jgi:acyl carrier protein